jgi:hypothetical protein
MSRVGRLRPYLASSAIENNSETFELPAIQNQHHSRIKGRFPGPILFLVHNSNRMSAMGCWQQLSRQFAEDWAIPQHLSG